jgi:agmatinase
MMLLHPEQFMGIRTVDPADADALVLPLPLERTVSYGTGTARGPRAILDASCQLELFDEETGIDLRTLGLHTTPPVAVDDEEGWDDEGMQAYLERVRAAVRSARPRFVLGLGGEHTITYGIVSGLDVDPGSLTVVQVDAHADLLQVLAGRRFAHGTVLRRVRDLGCRVIQIGIRSASLEEFETIDRDDGIETYFAHDLADRWPALLERLRTLRGPVYVTFDLDGLDPGVMPSVGTPQPDGLSWRQAMTILQAVADAPLATLVGADVVELVASPHPPGYDIVAAKLVLKILAFRARRLRRGVPR